MVIGCLRSASSSKPLSTPQGDLATIGDINAATTSSGDPSGAHDHSGTTGGTPTAVGGGGATATGGAGLVKSASFTALSALDQQAAAAAAAAASLASGAAALADGPPGGVPVGAFSMGGLGSGGGLHPIAGAIPLGGGMHRVHSTPSLHAPFAGQAIPLGATPLAPMGDLGAYSVRLPLAPGGMQPLMGGGVLGVKLEGTYWSAELPQGGAAGGGGGMNRSRSCGNLALGAGGMAGGMGGGTVGMGGMAGQADLSQQMQHHHQTVATAAMLQQQQHHHHPQQQSSEGSPLLQPFGGPAPAISSGGSEGGGAAGRPLLVRVGSEQHLIAPQPTQLTLKGMTRIASESHLGSMVPITPTSLLAGGSPGGELSHQAQHQAIMLQQQHMQQQQALYQHHQQQLGLLQHQQQQQQMAQRQGMMMQRSHSVAVMGALESIDEMQTTSSFPAGMGGQGVSMALGGGGGSGMVPLAPGGAHTLLGTAPPGGPLPGGVAMGGLHGGYSHGPLMQPSLMPAAGCDPSGGGGPMAPGSSADAARQLASAGLALDGKGGGGSATWEALESDRPESPFAINGSVHIGGEELDMTLAFLSDGPGGDVSDLQGGPGGLLAPSPGGPSDLGGSSLLLGDGVVRMDETAG
jgi:hypothetical protein